MTSEARQDQAESTANGQEKGHLMLLSEAILAPPAFSILYRSVVWYVNSK